jgi:hypothetical protein
MNPIIETYFDALEMQLIQTPAVIAYQIISREVSISDGNMTFVIVQIEREMKAD